jgi:hypothetical protein
MVIGGKKKKGRNISGLLLEHQTIQFNAAK